MDEIIVKVVYTKLLINTHTHCSNAVSSIFWNGGNKYKDTRYIHTYIVHMYQCPPQKTKIAGCYQIVSRFMRKT